MPYSENNKLTHTAQREDHYVYSDYYATLEAGKTYTFSFESDAKYFNTGDTVEIYLLKDKKYDASIRPNGKNCTITPTVSGDYYIRYDVNLNGATHSFWNFYIAEEDIFSGFEPYITAFDTEYTDGANFEGTEILKDVLTAAAEATQTIYFIDSNDNLVFKRLDKDGEAVKTISKANYITLDSSTNRRLATICHATELGDNVSTSKMEKSNKTINVDLGDNELCSIGDVKDELIVENSQAKIIKRIGKVVLNGSEAWAGSSYTNDEIYSAYYNTLNNIKYNNQPMMSDKFNYMQYPNNSTKVEYISNSGSALRIGVKKSRLGAIDLGGFKNWLSTNNVIIYYELATPEEIDFDISGYNLADGVYYGESIQEATPSPDNPSEIVNKKAVDANILYPITGTTQYVRDNPFWELREDIAELLEEAKNAICGITINQFNCNWRGDLALEIGDKIALVTKDNNMVTTYLLNDVITYNGGLNQSSEWQYTDDEESESNPNNLGEALKQTFAKVDKANKQIDLLVSEVDTNSGSISSLQMKTDAINANVQKDINELTNKVNATMTAEDVKLEIQSELSNGVDKVTTKTGFTFDDEGLTVSKDGSEMTTTIDEDGMTVYRDSEEMLKANNEGVIAYNLHAKTYLIVGESSR
ncbi:MAG: hypothetical protein J6Q38_00535, partial [Clostridia bacterium]|nr:hypothetical protein [Clostridia bacterium]